MSKQRSMRDAIAEFVPDGCSVAMGLQMEQMIPFSAGHEIIRQKKRDLTLIGPISDILFDQMIGAGCVRRVLAAWVGNVMMGSAYNFRRAAETGQIEVINMTNVSVALALQAAAMGVPFLPTRTALGSDVAKDNPFFANIEDPFWPKAGSQQPTTSSRTTNDERRTTSATTLHAVRALAPDVTIVHVQRADRDGNAHCWGNFGVMLEGVRAAKRVLVVAEEIVEPEVISSDPNRTVIPGFLVSAVIESPLGAHPSPVQGCYARDNDFFEEYHQQTKAPAEFAAWADQWIHSVADRAGYAARLGPDRVRRLQVKRHAFAAQADFGY
jgi:glutaconate CoA-transferase subunit A